jgi:hypothetical protein
MNGMLVLVRLLDRAVVSAWFACVDADGAVAACGTHEFLDVSTRLVLDLEADRKGGEHDGHVSAGSVVCLVVIRRSHKALPPPSVLSSAEVGMTDGLGPKRYQTIVDRRRIWLVARCSSAGSVTVAGSSLQRGVSDSLSAQRLSVLQCRLASRGLAGMRRGVRRSPRSIVGNGDFLYDNVGLLHRRALHFGDAGSPTRQFNETCDN